MIINRVTKNNNTNQDSSYLNIEDDLLKDIKMTDIMDNKEIDTMIQQKLSQKKNNKKLINMKEFANNLNNYVSKVNKHDINNNNKNIKKNNNIIKKYNNFIKEKSQINTEVNNNKNNIQNINNKSSENIYTNNFPVDIMQNPKYYEKIVVNNIYDNKDNKYKNNRNKAKIYISNYSNNSRINNISNIEEKKEKNKNIKKTYSNDIILFNQKKNSIPSQNGYIKNIINNDEYNNKNSQNKNN